MATWHKSAGALLDMDIPALAATVSGTTIVCSHVDRMGADMRAAVAAARAGRSSDAGSRVSTLVVPHDLAWLRRDDAGGIADNVPPSVGAMEGLEASSGSKGQIPGVRQFVRDAAAALLACPCGKAALYIGGRAALADGACPTSVHALAPSLYILPSAHKTSADSCRRGSSQLRPRRRCHGCSAALRECVCKTGQGRWAARHATPAILPPGAMAMVKSLGVAPTCLPPIVLPSS